MRIGLIAILLVFGAFPAAAFEIKTACEQMKEDAESHLGTTGIISAKIIATGCTTSLRKKSWTCTQYYEELATAISDAKFQYAYFKRNKCQRQTCISVPVSGRSHMEWIDQGDRC